MKTRRRNYDGDDKDRLSDLPDCLLIQILSNLNIKQAVQMSILSPRWKNLWKHISFVSLNYGYSFETLESFTNFVSQFLSLRHHKIDTQYFNFECRYYYIESPLLERILKYVFSHHVQRLDMTVGCNVKQFPLCNFSYHTLTSLKLTSCNRSPRTLFPNSLKLPALTHLSIQFFAFHCSCTAEDQDDKYVEPFSGFKSLNTLIIQYCVVYNVKNLFEDNLFISSASLVNLTIALRNAYKFKLCTPNLSSFDFIGDPLQNLCGRNCNNNCSLSSVKHARIVLPLGTALANSPFPSILFNWLVELALMESFTISSTTLLILNLIPDSWKIDFPYLHNLKLLKIETHELSSVPNGIVDFLLQNSPSAKKVIKYKNHLKDFYFEDIKISADAVTMAIFPREIFP